MGIKIIETENFRLEVKSVNGDMAEVRVLALQGKYEDGPNKGQDKKGGVLFGFQEMSRKKPLAIRVVDLAATAESYEKKLQTLLDLKASGF